MKPTKRLIAIGAGLAALGALAVTVPTMASAQPLNLELGGSLNCTYHLNLSSHAVAGQCTGVTPLGTTSGSLSGTVSPSGSGSGSFTLQTPLGSGSGSFNAVFVLNGTAAAGTFTVKGSIGTVTGPFIGTELL
ncbi:MAG TPA: hypothetical protein VG317_18590 [Pseudonocardiaceae bacterium]|jgi:hypothetical protein|nr:hypothetical protein [Pseudonocardiaceae bacterium]